MLDDGRAGVLVGHGDRRALREGLLALLADPSLRARLGAAAREHCEEHYDCRKQFASLVGHLREAAAGHSHLREAAAGH